MLNFLVPLTGCMWATWPTWCTAAPPTVRREDHTLIGAAAVMMPGTTVGKGSTLGAMAASLPGAQLPGGHSAPAAPVLAGCPLQSTIMYKQSYGP